MAAIYKIVKDSFIRYTKKEFPDESDRIIQKAEALFPVLHSKAPDIGGDDNMLAYNLDMMILAAAFYEASDHRIDEHAITAIAKDIFDKYRFLRKIVNINHTWQMKLLRSAVYKRYIPYAQLLKEKVSHGEWGNTWRLSVNPRNTDEGICFELIGCPLADFAKANGYENLLPALCASDHMLSELIHAKLIRTHTCAAGASSCDYWYVPDRSETVKVYENVKML